jgi:hypothetical protein
MLTTLAACQLIPTTPAPNPVWLNQLLVEADAGVKKWCKLDLEWSSYPGVVSGGIGDGGYYSGVNQPTVQIRNLPVLLPQTTIASGSNNQQLPQGTINVASTNGFNPNGGTFSIVLISGNVSQNPSCAAVTYTGLTSTTFTGCSTVSTGTMQTGMGVWGIAVWFDQNGLGGQYPNAFANQTLLTPGQGYFLPTRRMVPLASGSVPADFSGMLTMAGYQALWGGGFGGWGAYGGGQGGNVKLSARQLPSWPQGYQNIKVCYQAGWPVIPADLSYAVQMLVAWMVTNMPTGSALQSMTLGSYSFSLLAQNAEGQLPQLGNLSSMLSHYRDLALGGS